MRKLLKAINATSAAWCVLSLAIGNVGAMEEEQQKHRNIDQKINSDPNPWVFSCPVLLVDGVIKLLKNPTGVNLNLDDQKGTLERLDGYHNPETRRNHKRGT